MLIGAFEMAANYFAKGRGRGRGLGRTLKAEEERGALPSGHGGAQPSGHGGARFTSASATRAIRIGGGKAAEDTKADVFEDYDEGPGQAAG